MPRASLTPISACTEETETMTFLLKQIFAFLKLLNSDKGTNQIAAGIACGLILGFAPAFSLQTLLVVVILFFFRIQIGAATVAAFFFAFIAWILDPIHHRVGQAVLETEALRPLFTEMYNMPIVPLTRFYNSIVMGSALVSLVLALPVFFIARQLVVKYRELVVARLHETKFWKVLKATSFYKWYAKYDELY
jgi:uncharacterized protein (TIGR03546 family)